MAKSLLGLSHCFMQLASHFIPENSPLTYKTPISCASICASLINNAESCSSSSPHSFAVLRLTWLEQTALYSLILELHIGMQNVRKVPNMRKRRAVKRGVYLHRIQWRILYHGKSEAPKRDITDIGKIKFQCTLLGKGYYSLEA